jgi:hypothetical protein
MLEHMWGDNFDQLPQTTRVVEPPPPIARSWIDSPSARARTYQAVGQKLSSPMSDDMKEQVRTVFAATKIFDENGWNPENSEREKVQTAVERCKWYSDAALRLKIYGEFAQMLYPQCNYEQLPMLPEQYKDTVKSLYVAVLLDGICKSQYECLLDALKSFSTQAPLADADTTDRIGRERAARWNVRYVPEHRPTPATAYVGSPDGWR